MHLAKQRTRNSLSRQYVDNDVKVMDDIQLAIGIIQTANRQTTCPLKVITFKPSNRPGSLK